MKTSHIATNTNISNIYSCTIFYPALLFKMHFSPWNIIIRDPFSLFQSCDQLVFACCRPSYYMIFEIHYLTYISCLYINYMKHMQHKTTSKYYLYIKLFLGKSVNDACSKEGECENTLYCARSVCQCASSDYWTGSTCSISMQILSKLFCSR